MIQSQEESIDSSSGLSLKESAYRTKTALAYILGRQVYKYDSIKSRVRKSQKPLYLRGVRVLGWS